MAKPTKPPKDHVYDPGDMAAMAYMTNIDRRHATRTVPLRVLCLGQSRTGTTSLRQALVDLGYKACYHYASIIQENPRDAELWVEALDAKLRGVGKPYGKGEWDALLGHCQAVTDTPCTIFYRELLEAYPDAKVILTVRDSADQWHRSQMNTIIPYATQILPSGWIDRIKVLFAPWDSTTVKFAKLIMYHSPIRKELWNDYHNGTTTAKQAYEDYNAEVQAIVPKENLLVFNVKEGWTPLCKFLGESVPDEPFPRRNDTAVFAKNTAQLGAWAEDGIRKNMTMVGAGLAAGVGVAIAVFAGMREWK